jgi:hypothetical protein
MENMTNECVQGLALIHRKRGMHQMERKKVNKKREIDK